MLTIGKIDSEHYYVGLTTTDRYYTDGGQTPGTWVATRFAAAYGLLGTVQEEQLSNLLKGRLVDGTLAATRKGRHARRPGFDLCFSAPKSVSVAWALADPATRRRIEEAHRAAVRKALRYVEDHLAFTRRGKYGQVQEKVDDLLMAHFLHAASRELDPQLHSHVVLINLCRRADGTTGTLDASHLFKHQLTPGALYRQHLSYELERRLGLLTYRPTEEAPDGSGGVLTKSWFEVSGVPASLLEEFSKRRRQIEEALAQSGREGARAAEIAALATREAKDAAVTLSEILPAWREVGAAHGFGTQEVLALLHRAPARANLPARLQGAVGRATARVSESHAHFSPHDLVRYAAEEAQGEAIPAPVLAHAVRHTLATSPEFVSRRDQENQLRYSTVENSLLEEDLLNLAEKLSGRRGAAVREELADDILSEARWATLKDEQRRAVEHVTQGDGSSIKIVSGMAGTGKTFMLDAAREVLEAQNFRVLGAAFTGRAAWQLQRDAHVQTSTVHRLLLELGTPARGPSPGPGLPEKGGAHGGLVLGPSTVLVIDEAGMVGTKQMKSLLDHVERSGATLVLVGDERQIQPIAAGGPFKSLAERLGHVSLREITRQKEPWAREAVHSFAAGRSREGLEAYARRGLLTVARDADQARAALVTDWARQGGTSTPHEHLMLAATRADAALLNRLAQETRMRQGKLGGLREGQERPAAGASHFRAGKETIYENDRVILTRNSRYYGVENGNLGTVACIDPDRGTVTVWLDDKPKPVTLSLERYNRHGGAIRLGYAATTHKAQGASIRYVYVLAGADRELTYVQTSRAKELTRLYTDEIEAGPELAELARTMSKSHQKNLYHDLAETPPAETLQPELETVR